VESEKLKVKTVIRVASFFMIIFIWIVKEMISYKANKKMRLKTRYISCALPLSLGRGPLSTELSLGIIMG
jgi:hypothetical protein